MNPLAEQPKQSQRLRDYIYYSETVALSIKSLTGVFDNARPEEQVKEKKVGRKEGEKTAGDNCESPGSSGDESDIRKARGRQLIQS